MTAPVSPKPAAFLPGEQEQQEKRWVLDQDELRFYIQTEGGRNEYIFDKTAVGEIEMHHIESLVRAHNASLSEHATKSEAQRESPDLEEKDAARPATASRQMECEDSVIDMIRRRRARGRAKYGHTMERQDLTMREWLTHAQEEALDLAIYLEAIMRRTDEDVEFAARRLCWACREYTKERAYQNVSACEADQDRLEGVMLRALNDLERVLSGKGGSSNGSGNPEYDSLGRPCSPSSSVSRSPQTTTDSGEKGGVG